MEKCLSYKFQIKKLSDKHHVYWCRKITMKNLPFSHYIHKNISFFSIFFFIVISETITHSKNASAKMLRYFFKFQLCILRNFRWFHFFQKGLSRLSLSGEKVTRSTDIFRKSSNKDVVFMKLSWVDQNVQLYVAPRMVSWKP